MSDDTISGSSTKPMGASPPKELFDLFESFQGKLAPEEKLGYEKGAVHTCTIMGTVGFSDLHRVEVFGTLTTKQIVSWFATKTGAPETRLKLFKNEEEVPMDFEWSPETCSPRDSFAFQLIFEETDIPSTFFPGPVPPCVP
jgi:hypothetical protein